MKMIASLQTSTERRQNIEQICLRLLSIREHSRQELRQKLAVRGYSTEEVEPVINEISERNWQNDERYAELFVRQRIEKGYGPVRIRYELQQRGIREFDIDALADENYNGWINSLKAVYLKKYDNQTGLNQTVWLKRSKFLQQRGFYTDTIKQLFNELKIKCQPCNNE